MHYLDTIAGMTPYRAWLLYGIKKAGWTSGDQFLSQLASRAAVVERPAPVAPPAPVVARTLPVVAAPIAWAAPSPRPVRRRGRFAPDTDMRHARPYGTTLVKRLLSAGRVMPEYDRTGRDDERWRRSYDRSRQLTL